MIRHLYLACLVPISIALLSCGESTPQPQKGKYGYLPSPTPKATAAPTPTPIPIPVPTPTPGPEVGNIPNPAGTPDRKSTRLNSSHMSISYAVFCLKKKKKSTSNKVIYNMQKI